MRTSFSILTLLIGSLWLPVVKMDTLLPYPVTIPGAGAAAVTVFRETSDSSQARAVPFTDLDRVLRINKPAQLLLGTTRKGRKVNAWYFPGSSDKRALVIGGVHGSELSSIEMAEALIARLQKEAPYYSVIVIPALFPDNAAIAMDRRDQLGSELNIGRYSHREAVDPNRQMPSPGKAFDEDHPTDHLGRTIEPENQFLLALIRDFRPLRIANLHAIRNTNYGGIYADPRTDNRSLALGYDTDSILAIEMARYVRQSGGNVAGNSLDRRPRALYYRDPKPVTRGLLQARNMTGSTLNGHRGSGVSLGTWGTTGIVQEADAGNDRVAMRVITVEFPGARRSVDHSIPEQREHCRRQIEWFAAAVEYVFLGEVMVEP